MKLDVRAIREWNLDVKRSTLDYERSPSRACLVATCFELHVDGYRLCRHHRRPRTRDRSTSDIQMVTR